MSQAITRPRVAVDTSAVVSIWSISNELAMSSSDRPKLECSRFQDWEGACEGRCSREHCSRLTTVSVRRARQTIPVVTPPQRPSELVGVSREAASWENSRAQLSFLRASLGENLRARIQVNHWPERVHLAAKQSESAPDPSYLVCLIVNL